MIRGLNDDGRAIDTAPEQPPVNPLMGGGLMGKLMNTIQKDLNDDNSPRDKNDDDEGKE